MVGERFTCFNYSGYASDVYALLGTASIRHGDGFTTGPARQRGQDRVGGIAEETHAAIGEQEIRPVTQMRAPEMKCIALIGRMPATKW